jgi:TonB-linked SusC/RagA family outer membrane protein
MNDVSLYLLKALFVSMVGVGAGGLMVTAAAGQSTASTAGDVVASSARFEHEPVTPSSASTGPIELTKAARDVAPLNRRVAVALDAATVEDALIEVAERADLEFAYLREAVDVDKTVQLHRERITVHEVLRAIVRGTDLKVMVMPGTDLIWVKEHDATLPGAAAPVEPVQLPSAAAASIASAPVQTGVVEGTITDAESGETLPGVNVTILGTQQGAATGPQGRFRIAQVQPGTYDLQASFVGYRTETVEAVTVRSEETTTVDIALERSAVQLDEVVAIGYGTERRRNIAGSISSVSTEEIENLSITSPEQALQGKVAGVQLTQSSGEPGAGISVRIRGTNSINASSEPLYVIDGVPVFPDNALNAPDFNRPTDFQYGQGRGNLIYQSQGYSNILSTISPSAIESIEVLKDASATAIYGARAANGVVIITTKRGLRGTTRVNFESYMGAQHAINSYDLLNARQFAEFANEVNANSDDPLADPPYDTAQYGAGTDWQDRVFGTGITQNYSVNVSGGDQNTNYLVSGTFFDESGAVSNTGLTRYSMRFNLDQDLGGLISVGSSISASRTDQQIRSVVGTTLRALPTSPVHDDNGNFFLNTNPPIQINSDSRIDNPVAVMEEVDNNVVTGRMLGNVFGTVTPIAGLTLRADVGADVIYSKGNTYQPTTTLGGRESNGTGGTSQQQNYSWLVEGTATYEKTLAEVHALRTLAGYTFQRQQVEKVGVRSSDFPTDALRYFAPLAGNVLENPRSNALESTIQSSFGRVNYVYDDTYIFTATARIDGSSKFGDGKKYGFFPSGAIGWRLSNESFIETLGLFDELKVRASYGITGNQEIPAYQSLPRLEPFNRLILGSQRYTSFAFSSTAPNPELGWEETSQFNVGLDMGLFGTRLSVTADYYYKETSDLLFRTEMPSNSGFSAIWENIGRVKNEGVEFSFTSINLTGPLQWQTSGNIAFNSNEVLDLFGAPRLINNQTLVEEGQPIGVFLVRAFDGIWQDQEQIDEVGTMPDAQPGDVRYRDLAGPDTTDDGVFNPIGPDGFIDDNDRYVAGNPHPNAVFGLTNTLNWRGFDLSVFLQGAIGNDVYNQTRFELENFDGDQNVTTAALDRWTPENPSNSVPRAAQNNQHRPSDKYIEDASYLRLKNLRFGYELPVERISGLLRQARVYVSAQNVLTLTGYSGLDPDVNSAGQSSVLRGIDKNAYPSMRAYRVGLRLGF